MAVLTELLDTGLLDHVKKSGSYLQVKLERLKSSSGKIKEIRGIGLMIGIEINGSASDIATACRDKGLIIGTAGTEVVRLVPPLIIGKQEIDMAVDILEETLAV